MKNHIQLMIIFAIFLILIPCIAFFNKSDKNVDADTKADNSSVKILFTETKKVETLSTEDYIIGAVLAQMPADFEEETLKAQAVIAHTYAVRRSINEQQSPTENLNGAIMSDDTSLYQAYFTKEQAQQLYGDDYDDAYKKVKNAVKEVASEIITYNDEPIIVAFHAISGGKTESAKVAWGEDIPYLVSCKSEWDKEISGYEKSTQFTASELSARLSTAFSNAQFDDDDLENWIVIDEISDAQTVLNVQIGLNSFTTGQQLASVLSLPSPSFTVEVDNETFTFDTKGYGHLVGLSQYGANYLAKEGKTYDEILSHYFKGTEISKVN